MLKRVCPFRDKEKPVYPQIVLCLFNSQGLIVCRLMQAKNMRLGNSFAKQDSRYIHAADVCRVDMEEETAQQRRYGHELHMVRVVSRLLCLCFKCDARYSIMTFNRASWLNICGELAHNGSAYGCCEAISFHVILVGEKMSNQGICVDNGPYTIASGLVNFQILRDTRRRYPLRLFDDWREGWTDGLGPHKPIDVGIAGGWWRLGVTYVNNIRASGITAGVAITSRFLESTFTTLLQFPNGGFCRPARSFGSRFTVGLKIGAIPTRSRAS